MRVYNSIYIRKELSAIIKIGDNFTFSSGSGSNPITSNQRGFVRVDNNAQLIIGNNSGVSSSTICVKEKVTIGHNVLIGGGYLIMDNDCHSLDYKIRNGVVRGERGELLDYKCAKSAPISIGDNVLIGARCIILKGVNIGSGSIVGAGSVVSHSIPDNCVVAGNPCKVIKVLNEI